MIACRSRRLKIVWKEKKRRNTCERTSNLLKRRINDVLKSNNKPPRKNRMPEKYEIGGESITRDKQEEGKIQQ